MSIIKTSVQNFCLQTWMNKWWTAWSSTGFSGYSSAPAADQDLEWLRTTPNDSGSCCGCPRHGGEAGKHLVALHTAVPLEFVPLSTLPYQVLPQTKMKALLQLNEWMQDSRLKRVEAQVPLSCSSFNIYSAKQRSVHVYASPFPAWDCEIAASVRQNSRVRVGNRPAFSAELVHKSRS